MRAEIENKITKSGIEILFINIPNQEIVDFSVVVRAGFYYSPLKKHEVSHYLEHLAFDGTKDYPNKFIFAEEAEKSGALWNANTGSYRVRYFFQSAKNEALDLSKIILSQVYKPLFKISDFKAERKVLRNEINRRLADDKWLATVLVWGLITPRGVKPDERIKYLEKITLKDIKDFHKKNYVTNNTFIIISGDLNSKQKDSIISQIEKSTKGVLRGERNKIIKPPINDFAGKTITHRGVSQQEVYSLSFVNTKGTIEDSPALKVFSTILNGGFSSRIFHNIRESGLSYGTESGFSISEDYSEFYLKDYVDKDRSLKAFEKAFSIVKEVARGDFTDRELKRAKGFAVGRLLRNTITPADMTNWYLSDFVMGRRLISVEEYIEQIKKVTKKDVINIAKKYVRSDNWALAIVGEEAENKKSEYKKIIKKYK